MLPTVTRWDPEEPTWLGLSSSNAESTAEFGLLLAELLRAGDVLSLDGDLGAGKTAMTHGIAAGLRCHGPVSSPTFTLLMEHPPADGGLALYHFDVYRLAGADDFCEVGLDEYFDMDGVSVVEWGVQIADLLPARTLFIQLLQADPDQPDLRLIELHWPGEPSRLIRLAERLNGNCGGEAPC